MQARYYDPNAGRFLSVDPVGFLDTGDTAQFNRYNYGNDDPVNSIDPDGNDTISCVSVGNDKPVCTRRGTNPIMTSISFYNQSGDLLHMNVFLGTPSLEQIASGYASKAEAHKSREEKKRKKEVEKKSKKAKRHLKSKKRNRFKSWFHEEYKAGGGVTPGGADNQNPDGDDEDLADAWDEWSSMSKGEQQMWDSL